MAHVVTIHSPIELAKRGVVSTDRLQKLDGIVVPSDNAAPTIAKKFGYESKNGAAPFLVDRGGYLTLGGLLVGRLTPVPDEPHASADGDDWDSLAAFLGIPAEVA